MNGWTKCGLYIEWIILPWKGSICYIHAATGVDLENMLREISIFITYSSGPGVLQHPPPELARGTLITTQWVWFPISSFWQMMELRLSWIYSRVELMPVCILGRYSPSSWGLWQMCMCPDVLFNFIARSFPSITKIIMNHFKALLTSCSRAYPSFAQQFMPDTLVAFLL